MGLGEFMKGILYLLLILIVVFSIRFIVMYGLKEFVIGLWNGFGSFKRFLPEFSILIS